MQRYTKRRPVAGWGINDEDEYTNGFTIVDGKAIMWIAIIQGCINLVEVML